MTRIPRGRVIGWAALGLLTAAIVQSCGASGEAPRGNNGTGATGGTSFPDAGDGETGIVNPPENGGRGGESPYNPLCGVVECVPDRRNDCPPTPAESDSAGGGAPNRAELGAGAAPGGVSAGGADDGGGEGGAPGGEGGQGASGNAGGDGGQAGSSGSGGRAGSGSMPIENACRVARTGSRVRAQCLPAGSAGVDAPCLADGDCAPGLACVREGEAGQCRAYCCEADSCPERTHCLERPLRGVTPELLVPVCVPAVECSLAEPFPCPDGATCSCPEGLACMVVGSNRSTTCVEPGDGMEGDQCPCYWGHVCSQVTNRCVKLCQTAAPEQSCATGMCQVSAELPAGWGVCVGAVRPDAG